MRQNLFANLNGYGDILVQVTHGERISVPGDEDSNSDDAQRRPDAETEEACKPTFPQLQALIFQQLKNSVLIEVLEAVAGRVLDRCMGVRSDPLLHRFLEDSENHAPCVPQAALPRWFAGMWGLVLLLGIPLQTVRLAWIAHLLAGDD